MVIIYAFVGIEEETHGLDFLIYWIILCVVMIWFPLVIMITSFGFIYYKLRKSLKAFPYLSHQSKVARSRKKVIHMLLMLIIIEIICWSPWQSWIIYQFNYWIKYKDHPNDIPDVNIFVVFRYFLIRNLFFSLLLSGTKMLNLFCQFWGTTWCSWTALLIH